MQVIRWLKMSLTIYRGVTIDTFHSSIHLIFIDLWLMSVCQIRASGQFKMSLHSSHHHKRSKCPYHVFFLVKIALRTSHHLHRWLILVPTISHSSIDLYTFFWGIEFIEHHVHFVYHFSRCLNRCFHSCLLTLLVHPFFRSSLIPYRAISFWSRKSSITLRIQWNPLSSSSARTLACVSWFFLSGTC